MQSVLRRGLTAAAAVSTGLLAGSVGTGTPAVVYADHDDVHDLRARVRALQRQCDALAAGAQPISANLVLAPRHRVAITAWPVRDPRAEEGFDDTAKSFRCPEDFFAWLAHHGYEGAEFTVDDVRDRWMPTATPREIVARVKACVARHGIPIIGSLYHVSDGGPPCGRGCSAA